MKILVPEHFVQSYGGCLSRLDPALELIPLRIERRESAGRTFLRRAAERCMPYAAYAPLRDRLVRGSSYRFFAGLRRVGGPLPEMRGLLATWRMDRECLDSLLPLLPGLQWLHSTKSGVDHLPEELLKERRITVTASRGAHSPLIAEFVMGLVFCFSKGFLGHRELQERRVWGELPSRAVEGKTMGVLGTGSIGREVARRARANGMRVYGLNRQGRGEEAFDRVYAAAGLGEVLGSSDFVAVCLPLTRHTRGMIGSPELRCMKENAFLINIARDSIVDEAALVAALRKKGIAGAAVDVVGNDSLPRNHPFHSLKNVLITHHCAYRGEAPAAALVEIFGENLKLFARGEPLVGRVDLAVGY
ncbi:MAG: D-2-hydroxyacid dehydrogenase [Nitrospirales bacterium]|nr:D-2-hydroxyacid dehydrogenase [Nitrospirales bacterium]